MQFEQIKELINTVSASQLTSFQWEDHGIKIKMSKNKGRSVVATIEGNEQSILNNQESIELVEGNSNHTKNDKETVEDMEKKGNIVLSPLVGTFYLSPTEEGEPFVKIGDQVKKGQTLAIVEAMKLMNEIESEYDGVVVESLVENAQGVGYGQPLFVVR